MIAATSQSKEMPRKLDTIAVYLPPGVKQALEKWAEDERRSVSNLAAFILEAAVKDREQQQEERNKIR